MHPCFRTKALSISGAVLLVGFKADANSPLSHPGSADANGREEKEASTLMRRWETKSDFPLLFWLANGPLVSTSCVELIPALFRLCELECLSTRAWQDPRSQTEERCNAVTFTVPSTVRAFGTPRTAYYCRVAVQLVPDRKGWL